MRSRTKDEVDKDIKVAEEIYILRGNNPADWHKWETMTKEKHDCLKAAKILNDFFYKLDRDKII